MGRKQSFPETDAGGRAAPRAVVRLLALSLGVIATLAVAPLPLKSLLDDVVVTTADARGRGGGGGGRGGGGGGRGNDRGGRDDRGSGSSYGSGSSSGGSSGNSSSSSNSGNSSGNSSSSSNSGQKGRDNDDDDRSASNGSDKNSGPSERRGGAGATGGGGGGRGGGGNAGPPRTMVEVFDRMFKQPAAEKRSTTPAPASAPVTAKVPAVVPAAAPATARMGARSVRPAPVPLIPPLSRDGRASVSRTEFLAVNLDATYAVKARALGFEIGPSKQNAALGKSVSRVRPPHGTDAIHGLDMIRQLVAPTGFMPNYTYRLVPADRAPGVAVPAVRTELVNTMSPVTPCRGDRCAGRQLIQWSDQRLPGCSRGLHVGIIDTDVDHEHPAFARRLNSGTFLPTGSRPAPNWHGTGVLALLAGNPAGGTPGLIPHAEFYVASVFYVDSNGQVATDTQSLLDALDWMRQFEVKVINMSFAGPQDQLVQDAIARLARSGTVFVAAVGNEGPSAPPSYPAAYKQVVAVTAVSQDRRSYPYANRGDHVDLSAPGVDVWTAVPGMKEGYMSGTSFAAPFVTAAMATIYRQMPTHSKDGMLAAFEPQDLGPPGRDAVFGKGLVIAPKDCRVEPRTADGKPQQPSTASTPSAKREKPETVSAPSPWTPSVVMTPASGRKPPSPADISVGFR